MLEVRPRVRVAQAPVCQHGETPGDENAEEKANGRRREEQRAISRPLRLSRQDCLVDDSDQSSIVYLVDARDLELLLKIEERSDARSTSRLMRASSTLRLGDVITPRFCS